MTIPAISSLTGFALLGSIGIFYQQIKSFVVNFFSFFIRSDEIRGYEDARYFMAQIMDKGKVIRWGNVVYQNGHRDYLKKFKTHYHFVFTVHKSLMIFIDRTLIIVKTNGKQGIKVTYLFGSFNLQKYLELAYLRGINFNMTLLKDQPKRFFITEKSGNPDIAEPIRSSQSLSGQTPEAAPNPDDLFGNYDFLREYNKYLLIDYKDIGEKVEHKEHNSYYWQEPALKLKSEVKFWLENRDWFEKRNIRWFRSAILTGRVGSGKSKSVLEVARELDIPLYRFDISGMSNNEFSEFYNNAQYGSIILIEDLDSVLEKRVNVLAKNSQRKQLLTFDHFINTINGVRENGGIFLIISSNFPEKLDDAILRAGRCDVKIEYGLLDEQGRRFIAKNILQGYNDEIEPMVAAYTNISVVEFQNKCIERALEIFNQNRKLA